MLLNVDRLKEFKLVTKINRTFRLDQELSRALDKICVRHGDKTYHIERSLKDYLAKPEHQKAKESS